MPILFSGYIGLFLSCFLSATLLPLSSEAVLIFLLHKKFDVWTCVFIATAGNTFGGMTNYVIGLAGKPHWIKRLRIKEESLHRFENKIQKYGYWLAFFSWIPFIGDPLTVALGFFRVSWKPVLVLIILGKFLRYLILILPFL